MQLVDTHTHLYLDQFNNDLELVMQRAFEIGVEKLIFPAIDSSYLKKMLDIKNKYPDNIFLMSGLHPVYVKENYKEELEKVSLSLKNHKFIAIGEIGIDLYWDKTFLKQQQDAFEYQIRLAIANDLPIVIHSRESFDEIFEILDNENCKKLRGVFHCFTGSMNQAKRAIDLGFKLGIGGVVTFKNGGLDKFIDQINLENIVLETDSPYLAPVPYRGKRNESYYIKYVLNKLSEIYNISETKIAEITNQNSIDLFKI
tara:strand:+ start:99 stop:866 length:768 start_codon:yes stop_codon:yes gene_type:complete